MPALATRMSILPYFAATSSTPAWTCVLVGDVHRDREGLATRGLDLLGGRRGGVAVEIGDYGDGALGREAAGDLPADAAGTAGYDRDPSIEAGHFVFLSSGAVRRDGAGRS